MPYPHAPRTTPRQLACLLFVCVAAASAFAQEADSDWTQHFRLGMPVVFNIKANFQTSGQFAISGSQPGAAGVSGVNHVYDDGYVKVDATGNAQGFTSFWGYNSASQLNTAANTLTYHSATSYTTAGGSATVDSSAFVGVEAAYGYSPWKIGPAHIGFDIGAGWLPIKLTDDQTFTGTVNRSIFSFDTGGIIVPTAPYNGGSSGIGPTIHDVATALPGDTEAGTISGTRTLDVNLYTVRLGPTVSFELAERLGVTLGAGPALGVVNGNYKFNETISVSGTPEANNTGSFGITEVTYGGYANAALIYRIIANGDVYVSAQYMPLKSVSVSSGGREARLDLGGQASVSVGLYWPF